MTLAQVAGALLLSQRHVEALEADEPTAFYNHTFYDQARRRYAVLLGLAAPPDEPPATPIAADLEAPPVPQITLRPTASSTISPHRASPVTGARIRAALLALVLVVSTALLIWQRDALVEMLERVPGSDPQTPAEVPSAEPEPPPAPPDATPSTAESPLSRESAPAVDMPPQANGVPDATRPPPNSIVATEEVPNIGVGEHPGDAAYLFEAQRLCWVFARETSGKETKVTLKAGQRLALPAQLNYLAVGDLSAVRIWVDSSERDLASFSANGRVARLGPAELRVLRNGSGASNLSPTD